MEINDLPDLSIDEAQQIKLWLHSVKNDKSTNAKSSISNELKEYIDIINENYSTAIDVIENNEINDHLKYKELIKVRLTLSGIINSLPRNIECLTIISIATAMLKKFDDESVIYRINSDKKFVEQNPIKENKVEREVTKGNIALLLKQLIPTKIFGNLSQAQISELLAPIPKIGHKQLAKSMSKGLPNTNNAAHFNQDNINVVYEACRYVIAQLEPHYKKDEK